MSTNLIKYQTRNPLMRWVIERFLEQVRRTVVTLRPRRIVDLGCGEGMVGAVLCSSLPGMEYLGIDLCPQAVATAQELYPHLTFRAGSILDPPTHPKSADLVLCLEVLEHLIDPGIAFKRVMEWTRGYALVSVPWEPWFRAGNFFRGRHIARLGNHPEHLHQFTPRSLSHLLHGGAASHRVWTCFPWILGLARP